MAKRPWVYNPASRRRSTLCIGLTSDLATRLWQHRSGFVNGFTKKFRVYMLVYAEPHATISAAIQREKQLTKWDRAWKIRLVESVNPEWLDLTEEAA